MIRRLTLLLILVLMFAAAWSTAMSTEAAAQLQQGPTSANVSPPVVSELSG